MDKFKKLGLAGLAALVLGLGATNSSDAKTVKVPSQYSKINTAVVVCTPGDTILVAPGTYNEPIYFGGLTLKSESGAKATTLNYSEGAAIIDINGAISHQTTIDGFTIQGASSDQQFGIRCGNEGNRTVNIKNNIIQNNYIGIGRSWNMYANNLNMYVKNNMICNNSHAGFQMSYTINGIDYIWDNVIRDNPRMGIETIEFLGLYDIIGNTFAKNQIGLYINPNHSTSPESDMFNNIFAYNFFDYSGADINNEDCNVLFQNENPGILPRHQGEHDSWANPFFCNPAANDYTLNTNSPILKSQCWPIGALGTGCSFSPAKPMTWGKLKNVYK